MTPAIAILGAGPSGLLLGRLLEVANISYIIYERDISPNASAGQGGTLDIHADSGQLGLKEAGLIDQFKAIARSDATTILADAKGDICANLGETGDADRPEIDRKDLRALLLGSVPPDRVHWGSRVRRVQKDANGTMSIHFVDGSIYSGFRLVVGADGAWSKARDLVTSAKPQYSGIYYFSSSISPQNPYHSSAAALAGKGNYMACGDGKQVSVQLLGDGSYATAVGLRLLEGWSSDNASLLSDCSAFRDWLLREHFVDYAPVHADMIKQSEGKFRAWPLYAMPTESLSWQTVPGVALIGDAAHVTTPFVGEGVNCAMFDSLQLSQQIIKYGLEDLDRAVSEYEELMFPRAIDLITRSTQSGELFFAPDAPRCWLRSFLGMDFA